MNRSAISTGNACVCEIASHQLKRDILPNHGVYYKGAREQYDKRRFIAFIESQEASALHGSLNAPFNPDKDSCKQNIHPVGGGLV